MASRGFAEVPRPVGTKVRGYSRCHPPNNSVLQSLVAATLLAFGRVMRAQMSTALTSVEVIMSRENFLQCRIHLLTCY